MAREIFKSKIPIISAVGHETDFTICDFVSDLRAPTPSAAAELVYPQYADLVRNISNYKSRLIISVQNFIERKKQYVERVKASKLEKRPLDIIRDHRMVIDRILKTSKNVLSLKIEKDKSKYLQLVAKLDALSPLKTLYRGYSVVQHDNGHVITKVSDVKANDNLNITVTDGKISVVVK